MNQKIHRLHPMLAMLVLVAFAVLAVALVIPATVLGALAYVFLIDFPTVAAIVAFAVGASAYVFSLLRLQAFAARFEDRCAVSGVSFPDPRWVAWQAREEYW